MAYLDQLLSNQFTRGQVIQLTDPNNLDSWALISSPPNSYTYGIVGEVSSFESKFMTRIYTAGETMAISTRPIPDGGGVLGFENGGVFVDPSPTTPRGIINLKPLGEASRGAGELVGVSLR